VLTPDKTARRSAEVMLAGDRASLGAGVELVFLLADTAFAVACNSHGQSTVAAGCDIAFVAPVHAGDRLSAEAQERHRAGRSGIYDVSVRREDGTVVAELRGRSRTIKGTLVPREEDPT